MVNYGAIGPEEMEGPYYISRPYYKAMTTAKIQYTCPVTFTGAAPIYDTTDFNKVFVVPYDDATAKSKTCLGIALRNLDAYAALGDTVRYAGMGPYARDISLLQFGPHDMLFVNGSGAVLTTYIGMPICANVSGFDIATGANGIIGRVIEPGVGTGFIAKVFLNCLGV